MGLSYQAHDARGVDDPSSVTTLMRILVHELPAGVLASEEDATGIDTHDIVPGFIRELVDHAVVLGAANTGVIDKAV